MRNDSYASHIMAFLDSCAFDPKYSPEDKFSKEIFDLHEQDEFGLTIAHSTEKEIEHPNTPIWVKKKALEFLFTVEVNLTEHELEKLRRIEQILAGNGKRKNVVSDAKHIFEAQKYFADFVTTDERILRKKAELRQICPIKFFKPSEFVAYFKNEKHKLQEAKRKIEELRRRRFNN